MRLSNLMGSDFRRSYDPTRPPASPQRVTGGHDVAPIRCRMSAKPLDSEYIKRLLSGKRTLTDKPPRPDDSPAKFVIETKPDPLKVVQPGYEQPGDKGDIWAQWIRQHRTGATSLNERWG